MLHSFSHQCLKQSLYYWKSLMQETVVLTWNAEEIICEGKRTWVESFEINHKSHDYWWDKELLFLKYIGYADTLLRALSKLPRVPHHFPNINSNKSDW